MATQGQMTIESFKATAAVDQYKFVGDDAAVPGSIGAQVAGVTQDKITAEAATAGVGVAVAVVGRVKVRAAATIVSGDEIATDAAGDALVAVSTNAIVAIARTDAASGEFVTIDLNASAPVKA